MCEAMEVQGPRPRESKVGGFGRLRSEAMVGQTGRPWEAKLRGRGRLRRQAMGGQIRPISYPETDHMTKCGRLRWWDAVGGRTWEAMGGPAPLIGSDISVSKSQPIRLPWAPTASHKFTENLLKPNFA